MTDILVERDDDEPLATVTISNPERRNAVSQAAMEELADTVRELDGDDEVRCLVVTGAGEAFCAGADLASSMSKPTAESIDRNFHEVIRQVVTASMPVVAKVDGPAVGAGASLAIACDLVYANESARIGFGFTSIGLTADSGATFLLPRVVDTQTAFDLLSSGDILDADAADEVGLFTEVVADGELDDRVRERAVELANGPTRALSSVRRLLLRSESNSLEEQLDLEAREQERMFQTADVMEGISAFTEDRDPEFEGQ